MRIHRSVGVALAALVLGSGSILVTSTAAQAVTELGGIDVPGYCQSIGYWGADLAENNAFGWECNRGTERAGIDMGAACRWQYNNPAAIATYRDASGPYNWYCFVNSG